MKRSPAPSTGFLTEKENFFQLESGLQQWALAISILIIAGISAAFFYFSFENNKISRILLALLAGAHISFFLLCAMAFARMRWQKIEIELAADRLTGLLNRSRLEKEADQEMRRAGRYHFPLSVCLMDIDDFQALRKLEGAAYGNEMLKRFAQLLKASIRSSDIIARYDEDTFCALLPHTDIVRAEKFMARLLILTQERLDVSFSAGVSAYQPGERLPECFARVEAALDQAKKEGKKRVRCLVGGPGSQAVLSF